MDGRARILMPYENFKIGPRGKGRRPRIVREYVAGAAYRFLLKSIFQKRNGGVALMTGMYTKKTYGQRCTVKVNYVSNGYKDHNYNKGYKNQWKNHGSYLIRKGAQLEDKPGLGFDETDDDLNIPKKLEQWQEDGDERIWKLIVSPERGADIDLKNHTRELMKTVEKDLGTKLQYVAIDHYNTLHPHVHLVIRGVREDGKELRVDREYFTHGFRERSQEILTRKLGLRTELNVLENRKKIIRARHITDIDREIKYKLTNDNFMNLDWCTKNDKLYQKNLQFKERLQFLEELGVAKEFSSASWHVNPKFIDYLKFTQEQGDIIKSKSKHLGNIIGKDLPVITNKLPNVGDAILGRISGSGLNESNEEQRYLLIEGVDSKLHYVPMNSRLTMMRDSGQLNNGALVYLERAEFDQRKTIQKGQLSGLEAIKGTILDPASSNGVWENVSATEVRLKQDSSLQENIVKTMAKGDFDKILPILQEAGQTEKRQYLKAKAFDDWNEARAWKKEITDMDRYMVKNMVRADEGYKQFMSVERSVLDISSANKLLFSAVKKFFIPGNQFDSPVKQEIVNIFNSRLSFMEQDNCLKVNTNGQVDFEDRLELKQSLKLKLRLGL